MVLKTNYLKVFIDLLYKNGLIYGYLLNKTGKNYCGKEEEQITVNFKKSLISEFRILSSPSYKRSVTIYKLNSLLYKNRGTIFIISSSVLGFSTAEVCLKNNVGGLLVCGVVLSKKLNG